MVIFKRKKKNRNVNDRLDKGLGYCRKPKSSFSEQSIIFHTQHIFK